jgi:UDP-galactopyranose mutase
MYFDITVVGAGLAGATAARLLAEDGKKVLVIEKRKHIGGMCYDEFDEVGILIHKYGPHIFHTNNKKIWDFVSRFTEWRYYQHKVLSYVNGKYVPFPVNRDTICEIFGVNISTIEVEDFLKKEVENSTYNNPPLNFRDVVVSQVGERLYKLFYENYTKKQWNTLPENLSKDIAKRIPIRSSRDDRYFVDKYQGIPKNGYRKMFENLLEHENIQLFLGCDWFEIKEEIKTKHVIYTGELDRFFNYCYGKLEYRSLEFDFKTLDMEYYQPVAVVNYPNDYDWTRITEFKHLTGQQHYKTTLCYEYPKPEGDPFYVVLTEENIKRREKYLKEVKKLEKAKEYIFVGRLAEYKYYDMDDVIEAVTEKINKVFR